MRCARCCTAGAGALTCSDCRAELALTSTDVAEVERVASDALAALAKGEAARASRGLQRVLRLDAGHAGAQAALIVASGDLGRFERARALLEGFHRTGAAVEPVAGVVRTRTRGRAARGAASERDGSETRVSMLDLALFYRQVRRYDLAAKALAEGLAEKEASPEAHLVRGSLYRAQGHPRRALTELKKARSTASGAGHAALEYEIGLCHEALSQLKKATQHVSAALALEPDNPHMHLTLGMLYEKQGRPRLARRAYRVASTLHRAFAPALVDVSFRLGLQALEDGNLERAVQEFGAGLFENEALFPPAVLTEIEHLVSHLIESEQFRVWFESCPSLQDLPERARDDLEGAFGLAARLAFYVGLSEYWDASSEDESDASGEQPSASCLAGEVLEPEAAWLEGIGPSGAALRGATPPAPSGRRKPRSGRRPVDEEADAKAWLGRAESALGFPPVPFEFVFEEWLNVQDRLSSARIADRPLAPPAVYQRLLGVLAATMHRARLVLEREGVTTAEDDAEETDSVALGTALWAAIVESYLLREALERCRRYPSEFLLRLTVGERYRHRRLFARAVREYEAAQPLLPGNASIHNFIWNLYIREGRYADAVEHCHAVLRVTPHYLYQASACNDLAYCMVERGESENLTLLYTEKARELAPHLFDAHVADTVAWLHYRHGRFDEALRLIEEVIEAGCREDHALLPTSLHFYHYGHILQAVGRADEAQEAFSTAREMEVDADSDWGVTRRLRKEGRKAR